MMMIIWLALGASNAQLRLLGPVGAWRWGKNPDGNPQEKTSSSRALPLCNSSKLKLEHAHATEVVHILYWYYLILYFCGGGRLSWPLTFFAFGTALQILSIIPIDIRLCNQSDLGITGIPLDYQILHSTVCSTAPTTGAGIT